MFDFCTASDTSFLEKCWNRKVLLSRRWNSNSNDSGHCIGSFQSVKNPMDTSAHDFMLTADVDCSCYWKKSFATVLIKTLVWKRFCIQYWWSKRLNQIISRNIFQIKNKAPTPQLLKSPEHRNMFVKVTAQSETLLNSDLCLFLIIPARVKPST